MYLRPEVISTDWSDAVRFIESHHLGLLTTAIPLSGQPTIQATHIPFLFDAPGTAPTTAVENINNIATNSTTGIWNGGDLGKLRCHLARSNPQAKALLSVPELSLASEEILVVFSDPNNAAGYVTPQWYIETKPATAKTVPTWNYAELQLYGHARLTSPSQIVRDLSDQEEKKYADKTQNGGKCWKVEDAPANYIEIKERAIVGVEITITKAAFKLKMSRENTNGDRKGVIDGLRQLGGHAEKEMADTVERLGPLK